MALTRVLLIKAGGPFDIGLASLVLTVVAIVFCLGLNRAVAGTPLRLLFERPASSARAAPRQLPLA